MLTRKRPKAAPDRPARGGFRLFGGRRKGRSAPMDFGGYADLDSAEPTGPEHATLGESLRAARHDKGLTLDELAETTRVRKAYLEALEEMRLDALPSRPFTIGYIRAYATALGLDADAAVERFKQEEPVLDEPLRNPVGVPDERDPRIAAFIVGAILIIGAIMTWNIAQRAMIAAAPPPPKASTDHAFKVLAQAKVEPIVLGDPLPAPVESTIPPPYETPGLAAALGLKSAASTTPATKAAEDPLAAAAALPAVFTPAGKVYDAGNPRLTSVVTIQAVKPGLLIARGADGSVYFARQLGKGDAYRVPQVAGLTLEVSNAPDFQVFVAGQSKGLLPAPQVLAAKLAPPEQAPVAPAVPAPAPKTAANPPPATPRT